MAVKISDLCYELYKIDWKRSHHVTPDMEMDNAKNWYNSRCACTYDEYVFEYDHGYLGLCYEDYYEFCENEYLDKDYIYKLLDDEKLIKAYLIDVKNRTRFVDCL